MSIPQPPDGIYSHVFSEWYLWTIVDYLDLETRNIIEKLASFVARMFEIDTSFFFINIFFFGVIIGNGPEFEAAARQKHENNPKFAFLHGGDYQHYYAFRVQAEKACKI